MDINNNLFSGQTIKNNLDDKYIIQPDSKNKSTTLKQSNKESIVGTQVRDFIPLFLKRWWGTCKGSPKLAGKKSYIQKRIKEKELNKFINKFILTIKKYPTNEMERGVWRQGFQSLIDEFILKTDLISLEDKGILLSSGMVEGTVEFVKKAREFSDEMTLEDIGQAMRNLWIMNITQLLLGKEIKLTSSLFAYSMLYPYTDNYLDHISIPIQEKIKICDRFEKKLKGENIEASCSYEESIFKLVDLIEEEFDRKEYPEVFESLICIHFGQIKSLLHQEMPSGPYEMDILGISVEKGGTSVLADAYLVNGKLGLEEARFFFGYGVLLQICDDLQDARVDYKNKHMTIVSQLLNRWPLDNITNGLINFTSELLDEAECFKGESVDNLKALIKKNCLLLILFAVAKNKSLYSRKYYMNIKHYFPFRSKYMVSMFKRLKRKFSKLEKSYGGSSIEDIIVFGIGSGVLEEI